MCGNTTEEFNSLGGKEFTLGKDCESEEFQND